MKKEAAGTAAITIGGIGYGISPVSYGRILGANDRIVSEVNSGMKVDGRNTSSPGASLDVLHLTNFLDSIQVGETPNAVVETGHKSTLWVQLGNITQRTGQSLEIHQANGRILNSPEAMKCWGREYEPGREPDANGRSE